MPMAGAGLAWDYRLLVSRSPDRPEADLYGFMLAESIPQVPLPLKPQDPEPWIDLQAILAGVYERAGYAYRLNYRQPMPPPPLSADQQQWVEGVLASQIG